MEQRKRERREESLNKSCLDFLRKKFEQLYDRKVTPDEAWKQTMFSLGRLEVYFPLRTSGKKKRKIIEGLGKGLRVTQIAERYGVTRAYVWYVKKTQGESLPNDADNVTVKE